MADWLFREKAPNEKARNPMGDEFFASNSDAASLIREAVQNSLDARLEKETPVHIRISFVDIKSDQQTSWLDGSLRAHLQAEDSGIPRGIDLPTYGCRALVFEDFNTSGLTGDMRSDVHSNTEKNAFFHFFRAEGISDKREADRGSWGIGKIVFPRTSKIRTFFALTSRHDDKKTVLTGQCILKYHRIDGIYYAPDGWFGIEDQNGFQMPVEEEKIISRFANDFALARKDGQTGLSIVIPYPDEQITLRLLAEAMLKEYYFPVLNGDLTAELHDGNTSVYIDAERIDSAVRELNLRSTSTLEKQINLSRKHLEITEPDVVLKMYRGNKPEWQDGILDDAAKEKIRQLLDNEFPFEIRLPMKAAKKSGEILETHISIVLIRNTGPAERPVFIRNGLIISQAGGQRTKGAFATVFIDDPIANNLLGKAENPAHTNWMSNSERFRAIFMYPSEHISFVKNAPARILEVLLAEDERPDTDVLTRFFSLPVENDKGSKPEDTPDNGSTEHPPSPPLPKEKPYRLNPLQEGFTLTGRKGAVGKRFIVRIAYDRLRGNPFTKWSPFDFRVEEMDAELTDIRKSRMAGNMIAFIPDSESFALRITGFDANRDLRVDVQVMEPRE